ncbi:hypothetical protein P7K49_001062 [Saguinus oedipus]|uniref:Chorein N-terminal domain-containing protein n=1 Tax=Saguinus oedipus TaxID=9490 RepID=A0ABQ9WEE2_SAGOE|nr:hypothetical protein P7K49_001062 [Saguinus oedipus]
MFRVEVCLDIIFPHLECRRIKYDPLKEEKQLMEAKQHELKRIEEAKQKVVDQENNNEQHLPEKQDTFAEKLVTQIIKNLQVKISSIHIRYEDDITNRDKPLSFGISLQNLSMQKYELIRLDNLFAYWNVKSRMFYLNDYDDSLDNLRNGIVSENIVPEGYDFDELSVICVDDFQIYYGKLDLFFLCPEVMWAYAIHGVLEVNVCPRLRMWSWSHIRKHRQKMKQYKELYKKKLTSKKPPGELLVSLEVKKAGYKIYKEGVKDPEDNKGWFGWLWSWSEQKTNEQQPDVKPGILEEMLTPEEKALLYEAIGYSETAVDPTLPKTVRLFSFSIFLRTVNSIVEFFRPPKEVHLAQLTSATLTKLEEFRNKTATGKQMWSFGKTLLSRVQVKSQLGSFPVLLKTKRLNSAVQVTSKSRSELPDVKQGEANLEEIMDIAYDSFDIQLTSIQLLYSRVGDNWREARKLNVSTQHILVPMHFNLELSKAMVFMDVRMPKYVLFVSCDCELSG